MERKGRLRHAQPHSKGSERNTVFLEPSLVYKMSSYPAMRTVCEDIQINGPVGSLVTHWGSQWTRALENDRKQLEINDHCLIR